MGQAQGAFLDMDEAALRAIAPRGAVRAYPKGAIIVNQGDEGGPIYVVLSGRVKIYLGDDQGKVLVLSVLGPGEYFGELVLDGGARAASVATLEPSRFFVIPRSEFDGLVMQNAQFARDILNRLIGRLRRMNDMVHDLALKDVYTRFVHFLNSNSVEREGMRVVPERLTQTDIAARIGGSREMVSRIVKDLSLGGYVSVDAKHIVVHKKLPAQW